MEVFLKTYEKLGTALYKYQLLVTYTACICLVIGMYSIEVENNILGFWLVVGGIWCGGVSIFSQMFTTSEEKYINGKAITLNTSRVRNSSTIMGAYALLFTTSWFIGLTILTFVLLMKTTS